MYCTNCGTKNEEQAMFCKKCGSPLAKQVIPAEQPGGKKNNKLWIGIVALVVIAAIAVALIFVLKDVDGKETYESCIAKAEKYLEELDYEKAEAFYLKAIEIDPKKKEPYERLFEIYTAQGEDDKAEDIKDKAEEEGIDITPDESDKPDKSDETDKSKESKEDETAYETEETEETEETKPNISEDDLRNILIGNLGNVSIADFCAADYDNDGDLEAFAIVGEVDEFNSCLGNLYFITEEGVQTVLTDEAFWIYDEAHHLLDFGKARFYLTGLYATTSDLTYVFGVEDNRWYEDNVSLRAGGMQLIQNSDLTVTQSAYDGFSDGTGHTWKSYYLYWDNGFHEYGGISITESDLLKCNGASEIINEITGIGRSITNIIYRANGIININYTDGDMNQNATLLLENSTVTLKEVNNYGNTALERSDFGGIYEATIMPDMATYPDRFPGELKIIFT